MIQIPLDLVAKYTDFIGQRNVKAGYRRYYVKWLRSYLDFCHKYGFDQTGGKAFLVLRNDVSHQPKNTKERTLWIRYPT